jgi:hypothetical protein
MHELAKKIGVGFSRPRLTTFCVNINVEDAGGVDTSFYWL